MQQRETIFIIQMIVPKPIAKTKETAPQQKVTEAATLYSKGVTILRNSSKHSYKVQYELYEHEF